MSESGSGATLQSQTQAFLREFFAKGEELVRELIEENERLRMALRTGEAAPEPFSRSLGQLARQIEVLEGECAELRRLVGSAQRESGGYRNRLDDLEREHYRLATMYVAGSQFHGAATLEDVLRTTTEILLNFVGVGRFTVMVVDEERQILFPLLREGGTLAEAEEIQLPGQGGLAVATAQGGPWRAGAPMGDGTGALMHLPLSSGTRLVGVVRIERFLPQKQRFEDGDYGLLELVSEHAGVGIETAWIRAHAREVPLQRGALERLVGS
jgi:GAF domain-containing protein